MNRTLLFLIVLCAIKWSSGANILYLSPLVSPSHGIWNTRLAAELALRGHNVTFLGLEETNKLKTNFTYISLKGLITQDGDESNFSMFKTGHSIYLSYYMQQWLIEVCRKTVELEGLKSLLEYPKDFKFDLIIHDVTGGPCLYPLIHRFNYPPSVAVTPFLLPSFVSYNFGNSFNPTYIPLYVLRYTNRMSFLERVWNVINSYLDAWTRYLHQYRKEYEIAKRAFGDEIPPMEQLERHFSLVLANIDPILDYPQSLAPNFIPVGGLHTRKAKQLPKDLQSLMDNAKNGVILFSLGTNLRSDRLTANTRNALLAAFSQRPETVIWKFESELQNLPKNVIIRKWLPQNDILGHPNVKLFIGHGGALSTQESIFHGVPIICIPYMIDQYINSLMIVNKKLGQSLDLDLMTKDYVLETLKEVLENPIYFNNMQKASNMFRDRTETPLQRAVFWTEYVLRHGGADFLNTPVRDFPFYKSTGLDIMIFLLAISISVIFLACKLCKFVLSLFKRKTKAKMN